MRSVVHRVVGIHVLVACAALGADALDMPGVWHLEFTPFEIRPLVVERESGRGRLDWYLLYTVKNDSDATLPLDLKITAQSDHNVTYSDMHIPALEAAVERAKGENFFGPSDREKMFPAAERLAMLKAITEASGDARAEAFKAYMERARVTIGPKETRRCIATFGALDNRANLVKIFVRQLTNALEVREKDGQTVLVENVLEITYRLPGDEFNMSQDQFVYVGKSWIKVERKVPAPADG